MKPLEPLSGRKKYDDIYRDLEQAILERRWLPGETLPTEEALARQYQVSRETVRKAQALLVENGFIFKKQRRGSVVLDVRPLQIEGAGLHSFTELQKDRQLLTHTKVLKNEKGILPDRFASLCPAAGSTEVIVLERIRAIRHEAVIFDRDYFFCQWVPAIPADVAEGSIYDYLENSLALPIGYATKTVTVDPVGEDERQHLDLHGDSHVVTIRSAVYLEDASLFQLHESTQRVDTFQMVDFARRNKYRR